MGEPGSDGNLNAMCLVFFLKIYQIICLMTVLTKGEKGQILTTRMMIFMI